MQYRLVAMPSRAACAALRRRRNALLARIAVLERGADAEFASQFPHLVAQVEAAFRNEEALLDLLGDACLRPRLADHAVLLCALHRTAALVEAGDVRRGRQVLSALGAVLGLSSSPVMATRPQSRGGIAARR